MPNQMKQHLVERIKYEMEQLGNKDVKVENIRMFTSGNRQCAWADVSYTWWLNAWDKEVMHKDTLFVLADDGWKSPLFT